MSLSEFELINKYFTAFDSGEGVFLGVGDDCALIDIPSNKHLAITTDTQIENVHFFKGTDPYLIGYKSLLVNTSDLAAMGAKPYCFTLSLTLPSAQEDFLSKFSQGLFTLAKKLNIPLIGGNTTKGELSITISAYGLVDKGKALLRSMAKAGDSLYVTGTLGGPGLAVDCGYGKITVDKDMKETLIKKSMLIDPRNDFACAIVPYTTSAIDISDGLVGDLKHILEHSKVGCTLYIDKLPKAYELEQLSLTEDYQNKLCLYGGGDYELLFTCPKENELSISKLSYEYNVPITKIGVINNDSLILLNHDRIIHLNERSFEHF